MESKNPLTSNNLQFIANLKKFQRYENEMNIALNFKNKFAIFRWVLKRRFSCNEIFLFIFQIIYAKCYKSVFFF